MAKLSNIEAIHKFRILKQKNSISYIKILSYNIELGFKCKIIKVYNHKVTESTCWLTPNSVLNYPLCSQTVYFDIENKTSKYDGLLKRYKLKLFKEMFRI